jgi:RimJ/RimL family protein N-acetyltransferase
MKLASSKRLWPWQKSRPQNGKTPAVHGRLIVLRPKSIEDAEQDYEWRTNPELAALDATVPLMITFREYLRYHRDDIEFPSPWSVRLAVDTLDGRHIGNCMYYDIDPERRQCEVGIMIGDRAYWGRGYGTDAVSTLLRHIFTETPIEHVYLHTLVGNTRAQKAFTKAGFSPAGQVRRDGYDFLKMEVWRDPWLAAHAPEHLAVSHDADRAIPRPGNGALPS